MNSSSSGRAMQVLSGLPGRLVHASLITEEQAHESSRKAVKMGKSLVRYVVDVLNVDSHAVAAMASQEFGVPLFDLTAIDRSNLPDKLIPASLMGKHHSLPLYRRGNRLFVGVSDPTNLAALDEMLGKVADQYEAQVDNAVDSLSSLMEPIIMSILGVLVGGLMIAMYLPIFMLGSVV